MRRLRIALAQINTTVGDLGSNTAKIIRCIDEARGAGADLVAFPELAVTGYPPEDLLLKPQFIRDNLDYLEQIVAASRGITAVVGFVDAKSDIHNAAAVIHDGTLVDVYHKIYLPTYGVFDEDRYFGPGNTCPVYVIGGVGIGVSICEDIWYAVGPTAIQSQLDAAVIVNVNGSPYHAGKPQYREKMLATRAIDNEVIVCYVNAVGGQDELVFDGNSMICDQSGNLLARGKQFQEDLIVADLDIDGVFRSRLHDPRRRKELYGFHNGYLQGVKTVVSEKPVERASPPLSPQNLSALPFEAEVYSALVLGVRDYVRKNGFEKVVIGLSGGIDSALTAAIAVDALGPENVTGVSMPSRYTSDLSESDAARLADNLGIKLHTIPIEPPFQAFLDILAPTFAGVAPDITEENLQARIRGNIMMALSNKFRWLVLTTGNKSEMATGYATLYGDMAGGFAVIKDVPKTLVYRLANYRNSVSPVIPQSIVVREPTAELRPDQRDVDSLPPYPVLDPILKAYAEEDWSFEDMVGAGFDEEMVKRVMRLVDLSEYKRRQAPPGIKITPRAFGRDRRLPITNRYRGY